MIMTGISNWTLPLSSCENLEELHSLSQWGINELIHVKHMAHNKCLRNLNFFLIPVSASQFWLHVGITWGALKTCSGLSPSSRGLDLIGSGCGLATGRGFLKAPLVNLKCSQGWKLLVLIKSSSVTQGVSEWCNNNIANRVGQRYQTRGCWEPC